MGANSSGFPDSCLSLLLVSATNCLRYLLGPSQANLVPQAWELSLLVSGRLGPCSPLPFQSAWNSKAYLGAAVCGPVRGRSALWSYRVWALPLGAAIEQVTWEKKESPERIIYEGIDPEIQDSINISMAVLEIRDLRQSAFLCRDAACLHTPGTGLSAQRKWPAACACAGSWTLPLYAKISPVPTQSTEGPKGTPVCSLGKGQC